MVDESYVRKAFQGTTGNAGLATFLWSVVTEGIGLGQELRSNTQRVL